MEDVLVSEREEARSRRKMKKLRRHDNAAIVSQTNSLGRLKRKTTKTEGECIQLSINQSIKSKARRQHKDCRVKRKDERLNGNGETTLRSGFSPSLRVRKGSSSQEMLLNRSSWATADTADEATTLTDGTMANADGTMANAHGMMAAISATNGSRAATASSCANRSSLATTTSSFSLGDSLSTHNISSKRKGRFSAQYSQETQLTDLRVDSSQDNMCNGEESKPLKLTSIINAATFTVKLNNIANNHNNKNQEEAGGEGVEVVKPGPGSPFHYVSYVIDRVKQRRKKRKAGPTFRPRGMVTTACMWHACRAITLGSLLVIAGVTLAVSGYLIDQKEYLEYLELSRRNSSHVNPKYKDGRFHLNNLSFAGPVVMGVGGFLVVAACIMTLEARDNAGKVVPATGSCHDNKNNNNNAVHNNNTKKNRFQSSASQTTFIDRDILAVLTETSDPSRKLSSLLSQSSNNKKLSCSSTHLPLTSGSSCIPELSGSTRQALTQAFINREEGGGVHHLHKCPSAPCIPSLSSQDFKSLIAGRIQTNQYIQNERMSSTSNQFRLLTPTLYRSQMARARQTLSMDCSEETQTRSGRAGYLLPGRQDDSLDLELGASASGSSGRKLSRNSSRKNSTRRFSDSSESSLRLDLHVGGTVPVTLLVRDESRSAKSYEPRDISPLSPISPFLTRKVRSASPCGGSCCPRGAVKQVSWGSASSLLPTQMNSEDTEWWLDQAWNQNLLRVPAPPGILRTSPTPPPDIAHPTILEPASPQSSEKESLAGVTAEASSNKCSLQEEGSALDASKESPLKDEDSAPHASNESHLQDEESSLQASNVCSQQDEEVAPQTSNECLIQEEESTPRASNECPLLQGEDPDCQTENKCPKKSSCQDDNCTLPETQNFSPTCPTAAEENNKQDTLPLNENEQHKTFFIPTIDEEEDPLEIQNSPVIEQVEVIEGDIAHCKAQKEECTQNIKDLSPPSYLLAGAFEKFLADPNQASSVDLEDLPSPPSNYDQDYVIDEDHLPSPPELYQNNNFVHTSPHDKTLCDEKEFSCHSSIQSADQYNSYSLPGPSFKADYSLDKHRTTQHVESVIPIPSPAIQSKTSGGENTVKTTGEDSCESRGSRSEELVRMKYRSDTVVELFDSGESLQGVDKNPSAHPPPHTTHNDVETREYEGAHQCSDGNTSHQEAQKTSEYCNISVTKIENKLDEQEPENAKFVTESLSSQLESEGLSFHTSVSSPKQAGSTEVSNLGSPSAEIVSREIKVNSSVGLERNDDSYDAMLPATPLNGPSVSLKVADMNSEVLEQQRRCSNKYSLDSYMLAEVGRRGVRRGVLVRQAKLQNDTHPDLTRKRHSFVPFVKPGGRKHRRTESY